MTPKEHIEKHLDNLRILFTKASAPVEALKPGERIPLTDLAKKLGKELNTSDAKLYHLIRNMFEEYPSIVMKGGAKGGIYKLDENGNLPTPEKAELLIDLAHNKETTDGYH